MLTVLGRSIRTGRPLLRGHGSRAATLALVVVAAAGALTGAARAADNPVRLARYATGTPAAKQAAQQFSRNAQIKLVVRLQSDSVAEARALSPTHALSAEQERAIVATAHAEHVAIRPAIESLGGRVVAEYHHALNGVAVMIERGQMASLAALPGVRSVHHVNTYRLSNTVSVPYVGAPEVWVGHPPLKGEGVKIAMIDTGIDYTHADFGGPGTVAAFAAAAASSTLPADPTLFGPNAPKVKGGTDLVGDAYNADDPTSVPMPDPNPLDCNGHGSHVSGTAAGFGVANGVTYAGPWAPSAYTNTQFDIGPGVAPKADLYAVRVFGCTGSTNVVTEAIDWAVANHMDVISMSLGSPFGTADSADAIAASNAAKAGISVVAAAGNDGPAPYIASTPASGTHVIAAAAMDARANLAGTLIALAPSGVTVPGVEADSAALPAGGVPVVVLKSGSGLALGCSQSDYPAGGASGALVVVSRGTCTFVAKATLAAANGAVAIGVVNNAAGYFNPAIPGVTLPFIELLQSDTPKWLGAGASPTAMLTPGSVANPTFETLASFSSGGPRYGDSLFKPNVSAPGVAIFSVGVGTGNGGVTESGTSMATPHVAGLAALTREAHPGWHEHSIEAAIVETANPGMLSGADPRLTGAGVIQAVGSTATQVVAVDQDGNASLSFGFEESMRNYRDTRTLRIRNHGHDHVRFNVSYSPAATATGVPHTVTLGRTALTVNGGDETDLDVTLHVPVATVGATHDANGNDVYEDAAGYIVLTPAGGAAAPSLSIPYYLTTRARSNLDADLAGHLSPQHPSANLRLSNFGGGITGSADFYSWGLASPPTGLAYFDTRAIGVQSIPYGSDVFLVFAINTWTRFSSAALSTFEIDLFLSGNSSGVPDYALVTGDFGYYTTGTVTGVPGVLIIDVAAGTAVVNQIDAPTDGSTLLLPVLASQVGVTAANPLFSYSAFMGDDATPLPGTATYNAFTPSLSNALYYTVPPGVSGSVPVALDPLQWRTSPALGLMIVSQDNASGPSQAALLRADH
jgi:subtilisin family serine protease